MILVQGRPFANNLPILADFCRISENLSPFSQTIYGVSGLRIPFVRRAVENDALVPMLLFRGSCLGTHCVGGSCLPATHREAGASGALRSRAGAPERELAASFLTV